MVRTTQSVLERSAADNSWFGVALYSPHIDDNDVEEWVRAALVESGGEVAGVQLVQVALISTKGGFGRDRSVHEKTLKDVLRRSAQGKVNMVYGHDVEIDPHASLTGRDILYYHLTATRVYSTETRDLVIEGPRALFKQADTLSYVRRLATRFGVDYGCVAAGLTHFHVDATITFTHSSHVEEYADSYRSGPDHPRKQFGREISHYQSKRQSFGQHMPRASWGNILSPAHVEALGGEDRIRRESGAHLIENWGDNLYLQLTESLWDCTNEDLVRLNRFLVPALFPNAPDPVYLDRSSNAYTIY